MDCRNKCGNDTVRDIYTNPRSICTRFGNANPHNRWLSAK